MAPAKLSPAFETYIAKYGLPQTATDIATTRANMLSRATNSQSLLKSPPFSALTVNVSVTNTHIALPEVPSHSFPLRIYKPTDHDEAAHGRLPVYLYFHGGFGIAGDADETDFGCRAIIARDTRVVIASFEYRLAPENAWDVVFNDAEYAMKWVAANAASIGGDVGKGFIVGGATAGAHLAAMCAIRARDKYPDIRVTGQLLIVPALIYWPDEAIPKEWKERLSSHEEMAENSVLSVVAV